MSNGNENINPGTAAWNAKNNNSQSVVQPDGYQPWDPNRFNYYFKDEQKSTDDMFDAFTRSNRELEGRGETNLPDFKTFIENLVSAGDLTATLKSDDNIKGIKKDENNNPIYLDYNTVFEATSGTWYTGTEAKMTSVLNEIFPDLIIEEYDAKNTALKLTMPVGPNAGQSEIFYLPTEWWSIYDYKAQPGRNREYRIKELVSDINTWVNNAYEPDMTLYEYKSNPPSYDKTIVDPNTYQTTNITYKDYFREGGEWYYNYKGEKVKVNKYELDEKGNKKYQYGKVVYNPVYLELREKSSLDYLYKQTEIHDWMGEDLQNSQIFSRNAIETAEIIEQIYPGFSAEKSGWGKIKVTAKNGNEIEIQTNLDALLNDIGHKDAAKLNEQYKNNLLDLAIFVENNMADGQRGIIQNAKGYRSWLLDHPDLKITEAEINLVKTDLYTTEIQDIGFGPMDVTVPNFSIFDPVRKFDGEEYYDEYPYLEELEIARNQFRLTHGKNPTLKQTQTLAIENLFNEKVRLLKEKKFSDYADVNDGPIKEKISLAHGENLAKLNKENQKEIARIDLLEEAYLNSDDMKRFQDLKNKLENPNYTWDIRFKPGYDKFGNLDVTDFQFIPDTWREDIVTLENGVKLPKRIWEEYNILLTSLTTQADNIDDQRKKADLKIKTDAEKTKDYGLISNLLIKDYNDVTKFFTQLGWTTANILKSGKYGLSALLTGGETSDILDDDIAGFKYYQQHHSNSLRANIKFEDAFKGDGNFWRFLCQEVATQGPIFMTIATGWPGILTLGSMSAGDRIFEMNEKERLSGGLHSYSDGNKWIQGVGFATSEIIFDRYLTLPIIRSGSKLLTGGKRQIQKAGIYNYLKTSYKTGMLQRSMFYNPGLESLSEGLTITFQNIISGRPITENLGHSMFSGLGFGTVISHTPFYGGMILSKFSDYNSLNQVRTNNSKIHKLKLSNKNINIKPEDKKLNLKTIKDLEADNKIIINKTIKKANNLKDRVIDLVLNITTRQTLLQQEHRAILNSNAYGSKQLKAEALAKLNAEFQALENNRQQLLDDKAFTSRFKVLTNSIDQKDIDRVVDLRKNAEQQLKLEGKTKPTWEQIEYQAMVNYNVEYILNDVKLKKRNGLAERVIVVEKNEDADAIIDNYYNEQEKLIEQDTTRTDKQKKDALNRKKGERIEAKKNVKAGAHGYNSVNKSGDGKFLDNTPFMFVENMAKDDRLETKTHELGHNITMEAISTNSKAFEPMAAQLVEYLYTYNRSAWKNLMLNVEKDSQGNPKADEVVANFLEQVAAGQIDFKSEKTSGLAKLFGFMLGNSVKEATGQDTDFDFAGETDIVNFMIGLGKKLKNNDLSFKEREIIKKKFKPMKEQADLLEKQTIKFSNNEIKNELDVFVQNTDGTRKYQTQTELFRSKDLGGLQNTIENTPLLDGSIMKGMQGVFPNTPAGRTAKENYIRDVKERLGEKLLAEFDPAKNESVFGWITGPNGVLKYAVLDIKTKYAKAPKTTRMTTKTGEVIDVEDVTKQPEPELFTSAEQRTSKLRKILDLSEKQMNIVRNAVIKTILTGPKILQTAKNKPRLFLDTLNKQLNTFVFKLVKNQLGTKSKYNDFIKEFAKDILDNYIPLSSIVAAKMDILYEPVIDPKTGKQVRMTTIEANNAGIPLEKDGSGPPKWKRRKGVTNEQIIDFFAAQGINPKTGKPFGRATKGTRKDMISRMIAQRMGRDATSEIVQNREQPVYDEAGNETGRTINVFDMLADKNRNELQASEIVAQIADKIDVDPNIKFSRTNKTGYTKLDNANKAMEDFILTNFVNVSGALKFLNQENLDKLSKEFKKLHKDIVEALPGYELSKYKKATSEQTIDSRNKTNDLINRLGVDGYLNHITNNTEIIRQERIAWILGLDPKQISFVGGLNGKNSANLKKAQNEVIVPLFTELIEKLGTVEGVKEGIKIMQAANASGFNRSIYGNNETFFNEVIKKLPNVVTGKNGFDLKKVTYIDYKGKKRIGNTIVYKGKKVTTSEVFEPIAFDKSLKSGKLELDLNNREKLNERSAKRFLDLVEFLKNGVDNGLISPTSVGIMLRSQGSSMRTPLKMAAKLEHVLIDKNNTDYLNYRYEHLDPSDYILRQAALYVIGNKNVNKQTIENKVNNSEAALLPRDLTTIVDKYHKNTYDSKHTMEEGNSIDNRVFSEKTKDEVSLNGYSKEQLSNPKDKNAFKGHEINNIKKARKAKIKDKSEESMVNYSKPEKGTSIFDLDDTLAKTKSKVIYTLPDGTKAKITGEEFAMKGAMLAEKGAEFDFSEFSKIIEGKKGPLFDLAQKRKEKFGNKDIFILTARPHAAARPIYEFLKSINLEIPLSNIITLQNSTAQAKADWVTSKVAEGYNNFYFADDVYANVKAVQDVLNKSDVKSDVQQAGIKFSKSTNREFNEILENKSGIPWRKRFSKSAAAVEGASKGKVFKFIPDSAEDFVGLLYQTLGKGKLGDTQMGWFKKKLLDPFARANMKIRNFRVQMTTDYDGLRKKHKDVFGFIDIKGLKIKRNKLKKKAFGNYTNEMALRVWIWNQQGNPIPNITKGDIKKLVQHINKNSDLKAVGIDLIAINKSFGYGKPDNNWIAGTLTTDLLNNINTVVRENYLKEWQQNVDLIFSEKNLNKLEAIYGKGYVEALQNSLIRMRTGRNTQINSDKITEKVVDYINNSTAAIMFFNTRSALLQLISTINFINWNDNNIYQAGKAFANQPQYWKDFYTIWNSDYLRDRRAGLRINVSEADIATAAKMNPNNPMKAIMAMMLKKGFLPTQIADSLAISMGGASFYRNRINTYLKKGMTQNQAEQQAMMDTVEVSEESQQSSRADKISQQQASGIGRLILAFANTPSQYARLTKKAYLDLVNGRGDSVTNVSKIVYYMGVQNFIFNSLQQALFALAFTEEEEEPEAKKERYINIGNGMVDSFLRGTGYFGAGLATAKNVMLEVYKRSKKDYYVYNNKKYSKSELMEIMYNDFIAKTPDISQQIWDRKTDRQKTNMLKDFVEKNNIEKHEGRDRPEYHDVALRALDFSPPIDHKITKLRQAGWDIDRDPAHKEGIVLNKSSLEASAKIIEGTLNIPLGRLIQKIENIKGALNQDQETWKRVAMILGWPEWQLEVSTIPGAKDPIQEEIKKSDAAEKGWETRRFNEETKNLEITRDNILKHIEEYDSLNRVLNMDSLLKYDKRSSTLFDYNKSKQISILDSLGLSSKEIKKLKYEKDRVNKIIELETKN